MATIFPSMDESFRLTRQRKVSLSILIRIHVISLNFLQHFDCPAEHLTIFTQDLSIDRFLSSEIMICSVRWSLQLCSQVQRVAFLVSAYAYIRTQYTDYNGLL